MMDPEVRRTILARVDAALDRLETAEGPPEGIAAALLEEDADAPAPDLYALLAQLTALTREVQLQGRAANRLSSEVTQLVEQVSASSEGQISARVSAARRDAQAELLGEILDIRERFARGREEARKRLDSFRGLFARLGSRPSSNPSFAEASSLSNDSTRRFAGTAFTRSRAKTKRSIRAPCERSSATSATMSGPAWSRKSCGAATEPPSASFATPK